MVGLIYDPMPVSQRSPAMPRDRFVCFETRRGHWFVIDVDAGTAVFDTTAEAIARDFCADRNVATGGRAVAPKVSCILCYGRGYVADPDHRRPSIRSECAAGKAA